ncbi:hypothetical protein GNX71_23555 [Variovorax sp. RKNM96]|uniref:hypothetical protein n=1 Tax=Variovorax sp. RKNM96 TaxID=2681552 RepID=UPI0019811AD4|nr:hypothetical protein [Variovorax sp. RKNM96]QSI32403.1 hypothetical protein GNX71_23555 [Variovorax sp. RKNM96]
MLLWQAQLVAQRMHERDEPRDRQADAIGRIGQREQLSNDHRMATIRVHSLVEQVVSAFLKLEDKGEFEPEGFHDFPRRADLRAC